MTDRRKIHYSYTVIRMNGRQRIATYRTACGFGHGSDGTRYTFHADSVTCLDCAKALAKKSHQKASAT